MSTSESGVLSLRDIMTDAIRYWERRRLYYNLILALIVVGMGLVIWPQSLKLLEFSTLLWLFVLAALANVCYTAAYIVDIGFQLSAYRAGWLRWRLALWIFGTVLAAALTYIGMAVVVLGLIL